MLHPSGNANYEWKNPSTVEEWLQDPSKKLQVLVQILQWHLAQDGRAPLKVIDNELVPSSDDVSPVADTPCDKIVVYCSFPSNFIQMTKVSGSVPVDDDASHSFLGSQ